ncbi:MAG TPA: glycerophosphodiester phosphodiesterase family protein [Levilinea sp.]|nr:glycerophosphodiester phosphodiesterase family protein [Levilinea sp.]
MSANHTWKLFLPGKKKPYLMAHRGNKARCPENTLASFRQALKDGADILETDVRLSADGVFMCIHDGTVDRTTDGMGEVASMTLEQLKTLSAWDHRPGFEEERIPTLAEVAALLPPGCALALELKTDRFFEDEVCRQFVRELDAAGVRDRTVVISFHLGRVQHVQAHAPDIPTGWITMTGYRPKKNVQLLGPFWPLLLLNPLYVWIAHRQGQMVAPLDATPDGRIKYYRWLNCDAILSDDPAKTARKLKRSILS